MLDCSTSKLHAGQVGEDPCCMARTVVQKQWKVGHVIFEICTDVQITLQVSISLDETRDS